MKCIKRIVVAVMVIAFSASMLGYDTYAAKSIDELKKDKEALETKEKEAETKLAEIKSDKQTLTGEIEALDIEIQLAEDQLLYIHDRLDSKNAEHDRTTEELNEAENDKIDHYEALKKRLKYIQENGKVGYLQVLFNSKSFGDFLNRVEYVNDIVTYDQRMYEKLESIEQTIAEKKALIETQMRDIEVLLMEQEEKMLALEQTKRAKEVVMDEIENDEAKYNQQIDELQAQSDEIAEQIKKAQEEQAAKARAAAASGNYNMTAGTGADPSGQYGWPVPGYSRLSSGYVNRTNPITGKAEFHTGIDIPAPYGTPIVAAESGTVIGSGTRGGYGLCVVIDHGGGMSTLYGHNSKLVVSVGDTVQKGQTIALCGSTGMSTGNHCHFEVRINGSPVKPNGYVGL